MILAPTWPSKKLPIFFIGAKHIFKPANPNIAKLGQFKCEHVYFLSGNRLGQESCNGLGMKLPVLTVAIGLNGSSQAIYVDFNNRNMTSSLGILNLFTVLFGSVIAFGYLIMSSPGVWKDELFFGLLILLLLGAHLVLRFGLILPLQRLRDFFVRVDNVKATPQDFQLKFQGVYQPIYTGFTKTIFNIVNATNFVNKLTEGKLEVAYQGLEAAEPERYKLVAALLKLRQQTLDFTTRNRESDWATQGVAKFVEVLRIDDADMAQLTARIIEQLVKYTGAAYGVLYIVANKDDRTAVLKLSAGYAHDRARLGTEIGLGEGLVGQAFRDKTPIHLPTLPDGYLPVSSGLGQMQPKELVIVPAVVNNTVFAVIELASMATFKSYEIDFLSKLGESIAAAIGGLQSNERTQEMLEASEAQAEMFRAQEDLLRQGMESYLIKEQELKLEQADLLLQNAQTFEATEQELKRQLLERDQEIVRLKNQLGFMRFTRSNEPAIDQTPTD